MQLSQIKFLIVDKTDFACQMIKDTLFEFGSRTICYATNAREAMKHVQAGRVTFVICEHDLDGESGFDLINEIRSNDDQAIKTMPVVLLTASTDRISIFSGRDAGVDEIVAKPFTAAALQSRIEAALNKRRTFIDQNAYAGPDRRRLRKSNFSGENRRETVKKV